MKSISSFLTRYNLLPLMVVGIFALTACNKEKQLSRRIQGSWNIDKITLSDYVSNAPTPFRENSYENVGGFRFEKNNTGGLILKLPNPTSGLPSYDLDIAINSWENTETSLTLVINGVDTLNFEIIENRKAFQIWKTEDILSISPDRRVSELILSNTRPN